MKRYLLRDWSWNFALAAWSPDFPSTARQALFFYERAGAPPVDGVIGMDFAALEGLLAVVGPREIDGYGITVDSSNVTEETLLRARRLGQAPEDSHAFARAVAATVLDGVFSEPPARWDNLLEALDGLASAKHLHFYATEPRLQAAVRDLGWAGELKAPPGDYLMLVDASVHSTKLNLVVKETAQLQVDLDWTGAARHTLDVSYRNGLPEWARGRDPGAVERLMGQGFYGGYLRLLAPPAAQSGGPAAERRRRGAGGDRPGGWEGIIRALRGAAGGSASRRALCLRRARGCRRLQRGRVPAPGAEAAWVRGPAAGDHRASPRREPTSSRCG